ncbi:MAG: hypothetical protein QM669_14630 [Siphonobacter sp.]
MTPEIGSRTAKGGFANEKAIRDKFISWKTDLDAQLWLTAMGYELSEIEELNAVQIPTRLKASHDMFLKNHHDHSIVSRFKKADIQIKLLIKIGAVWQVENISVKKAKQQADFNQIDKRPVSTYQQMWNFDNEIANALKLFTGETEPAVGIEVRDSRRMYLDELPDDIRHKVIRFFERNRILVVSDLLKGRGGLAADWLLVTRYNDKENTTTWIIKDINTVMNFFGSGEIRLSQKGSLYIGRIFMQRKGGTPDPRSLQFKIHPCELFQIG